MSFSNPIVGGTTLIRPAIHSPDFVTGVSGWSINKDGSAEFNDVVIRGGSVVGGTSLYYNGTPAAGTLIMSISANAGVDEFGNSYPAGVTVFATTGTVNIDMADAEILWESNSGASIAIIAGAATVTETFTPPPQSGGTVTYDGGAIGTTISSELGANTPSVFIQSPRTTGQTAVSSIMLDGASPGTNSRRIRVFTTLMRVVGDLDVTGTFTAANIQTGTASVTTVAGTWVQVTVTFANAFLTAPVVTVTGNDNAPAVGGTTTLMHAVTTISTTGFVLRVLRSTAITMGFGWIAIAD